MQIGTADIDIEDAKPRRNRLSRSSTTGQGSSGRGKDGGGGNDGGDSAGGGSNGPRHEETAYDDINRDKSRVISWFLLLVVLMTFGGLIGAYVVIATNRAIEWQPFSLPFQIWISTLVILVSSVTYELFRRSVENRDLMLSRRYLVATAALGGVFIASQLIAWIELVNRGLYMRGNPYAGFFYILTAAHAIHVMGGMVALGALLRRSWYPAVNETESVYRANVARAVGWYWHLMGGLWIVLFLLLGFWK
ncbi:MAG: cytochrome c oxidase subunit 3 [bacterium]|nr:cytochrome c oxidase subunit 3 [bacterium]